MRALPILLLAGCGIIPIPLTTTMGMKSQDAPPRVEVTDWDFGSVTDRHGLFYWTEEPAWDAPTQHELRNGKIRVSRTTANRPIVRVYIDDTLTGTKCRWMGYRLEQTRTVRDPDRVDFGTGVSIDSDDTFGGGQFSGDCDKIKAMVVDDPKYASVVKK
jgi:hypothetical protein